MFELIVQYFSAALMVLGYLTGISWLFCNAKWIVRISYSVGFLVAWGLLTLIITTVNIAIFRPFSEGITFGHIVLILVLMLLNGGFIYERIILNAKHKI